MGERVRLRPGLRVEIGTETAVVDGGPVRRRFRGAARDVLAQPGLADGIDSDDDGPARGTVAALVRNGVLVPAETEDPDGTERHLARTFGPEIAEAARLRIAAARFEVAGDSPLARLLLATLWADGADGATAAPPRSPHPAVVVVSATEATGGTELAVPVVVRGRAVEVGPLLGASARCPGCCGPDTGDEPSPELAAVGAAVAADELLALVGGYRSSPLWRAAVRCNLAAPSTAVSGEVPVSPDPTCPSCGDPGRTLSAEARQVLADEQAIEVPAFPVSAPAPPAARLDTAPARGYVVNRRWPAGPRRAPAWAGGLLDALVHATGSRTTDPVRDLQDVDRWTPQVADLGTHAYVWSECGPLYVDPVEHRFAALRSGPGSLLSVRPPNRLAVVLVGDLYTAARRLGPAGRRAVWVNGGFALDQLRREGVARGWTVVPREREPALLADLDLRPERDVIVGVVELSGLDRRPPPGRLTELERRLRRRRTRYRFGAPVDADDLSAVLAESTEEHHGAPAVELAVFDRTVHLQADLAGAVGARGVAGWEDVLLAAAGVANGITLSAAAAGIGAGVLARPPAGSIVSPARTVLRVVLGGLDDPARPPERIEG